MQYDVIRGVCDMSPDKEGGLLAKTKLLTGIMLGWCSKAVTVVCTKQMIYVVTG